MTFRPARLPRRLIGSSSPRSGLCRRLLARLPGRPASGPASSPSSASESLPRGGTGHRHGFRAFAAAALACAALMGFSATAQAQTEVWSGTLTVKDLGFSTFGCSNGIPAGRCSDFLSDDEFTYDSTDYEITHIQLRSSDGRLQVDFDTTLTTGTKTLTLDVAGTTFALADASVTTTRATWSNSGLSWSAGDPVVLRLTETVPTITQTEVTSSPASGDTYRFGETIEVTVTFSEAVDVTGTVLATLFFSQSTSTYRSARYVRGSGTTELVFEYTVAEGDTDTDGLQAGPHILAQGGDPAMGVQGGGTITRKDASTVAAVLKSAALFSGALHKVDGSPPTAPGAPVLTAVANGATQIDLSWTVPDTGGSRIDRYQVDVSANGGTTWKPLRDIFAITTTSHTGLTGGTTRHYRVSAVNAIGTGAWSNVANATTNTPATGNPLITGTPQVGQSLFVAVYDVVEPDGTINIVVSYQWIRVDGATETDITGATTANYTPVADDVGKQLKARLSFTDDAGNPESLTSAATQAVLAAPGANTAPGVPRTLTATPGDGEVTLRWMAPASTGGSAILRYEHRHKATSSLPFVSSDSWTSAGTTLTATVGSLANGTPYSFEVRAVNAVGAGTAATASATPTANTPATGNPFIIGMPTPQMGQSLSASVGNINDADGMTNIVISYQWIRVDGATETDIQGATTATYTPVAGDVGKQLKVRLSFTDDLGNPESRTSPATLAVQAAAAAPGVPRTLAAASGDGEVVLTWRAPASTGGSAILRYEHRHKVTSAANFPATWTSAGTALTATVGSLANGTPYSFEVRAVNTVGAGTAATASATPLATAMAIQPSLTIDVDPNRFGEADGGAQICVVPSAVSSQRIRVQVATADGTATAPGDYGSHSGTVALQPQQQRACFTVTLVNDAEVESDETFTVTLSNPVNATLGTPAVATFTIVDNDQAPPPPRSNNAPRFTEGTTTGRSVAENTAANRDIGTPVTATDADAGDTVTYSLGGADAASFGIVRTSGQLRTRAALDREIKASYTVVVTARDRSGATDTITVTITVTDVTTQPPRSNNAPTFTEGTTTGRSVAENTAANRDIGTPVAATDADAGDTVAYSLGGADAASFGIVSTSGQLRTSAALDYETKASYTVVVTATDRSGATDTITVTITVTDVGPPAAPGNLSAAPDSGRVVLTWEAPASSGGPPIDRYEHRHRATSGGNFGGWTGVGTALTATVSGLTGGTRYTFEVRAVSGEGDGAAASTVAATPSAATPPGEPRNLSAKPDDARVVLTWHAPDDDGGAPISRYEHRHKETSAVSFGGWTGVGMALTATVSGLTNGTGYSFQVRAVNSAGDGGAASKAATPAKPENLTGVAEAWLSRFGRTVAGHVMGIIGDRRSRDSGSHVTIGGRRMDGSAAPGRQEAGGKPGGAPAGAGLALDGRAQDGRAWGDALADGSRGMAARDVLLGSSFHLSAANEDGPGAPRLTAWGRAGATRFDGSEDALSVDGDVVTGTLGVDIERDRLVAGVAVSHSEGDGEFNDSATGERGGIESSLTAVHPYLRYEVNERLSVWGLLGYGTGSLSLSREAEPGKTETGKTETDISMGMGALGARGALLTAERTGGYDLAVKADAFVVRMSSDAASGEAGNLAAVTGDASRLRLLLEGSRGFELGPGRVLTPSLEAGLRHDGGDAETGAGLELGAGLRYADPARGLTMEAKARGLIAHEDSGFEEWGLGGSIRLDPGASGRGLSLSLAPSFGAASSGVDRLWSGQDTAGLAANDNFEPGGRLKTELGYGLGAPGNLGVVTPYAGLGLSDGGTRDWRLGARWKIGPSFDLNLQGSRRESANDDAPDHGMMLRGSLRW